MVDNMGLRESLDPYREKSRLHVSQGLGDLYGAVPYNLQVAPAPQQPARYLLRESPFMLEFRQPSPNELLLLWAADDLTIFRNDWRKGQPMEQALWKFVRLGDIDTSAENVLSFANKYGVLGICPHALPGVHDGCPPPVLRLQPPLGPTFFFERIAEWSHWARTLRAYLSIAKMLRVGEPGMVEDWLTIIEPGLAESQPIRDMSKYIEEEPGIMSAIEKKFYRGELTIDEIIAYSEEPKQPLWERNPEFWLQHVDVRILFSHHVSHLTKLAGLSPQLIWEDNVAEPHLALSFSGPPKKEHSYKLWPQSALFPVLIAQLLVVLTSKAGVAFCDNCGEPYTPKRLRTDRPNYCPNCQGRVPRRNWYYKNKESGNPQEEAK